MFGKLHFSEKVIRKSNEPQLSSVARFQGDNPIKQGAKVAYATFDHKRPSIFVRVIIFCQNQQLTE